MNKNGLRFKIVTTTMKFLVLYENLINITKEVFIMARRSSCANEKKYQC